VVAINAGPTTSSPITVASPEQITVGQTSSQDTLTKTDRLEIAYVRVPLAVEPVTLVTKTLDETPLQSLSDTETPKIVSRHWHDPNAKKSAISSISRRMKGQEPKRSKNVDRGKATIGVKPCRPPDGFAGLIRALNLSRGCET
jgi:hypothetical protein